MKAKIKSLVLLPLLLLVAGCTDAINGKSALNSDVSSLSSSPRTSITSDSSSITPVPSDKGYIPYLIGKFNIGLTNGYTEITAASTSENVLIYQRTRTLYYDFDANTGSEHDVIKQLGEFSVDGDGYTTTEQNAIYDSTKETLDSFVGMNISSWNITENNIAQSSVDENGRITIKMADSYQLGNSKVSEFVFSAADDHIASISYSWSEDEQAYREDISFQY